MKRQVAAAVFFIRLETVTAAEGKDHKEVFLKMGELKLWHQSYAPGVPQEIELEEITLSRALARSAEMRGGLADAHGRNYQLVELTHWSVLPALSALGERATGYAQLPRRR